MRKNLMSKCARKPLTAQAVEETMEQHDGLIAGQAIMGSVTIGRPGSADGERAYDVRHREYATEAAFVV